MINAMDRFKCLGAKLLRGSLTFRAAWWEVIDKKSNSLASNASSSGYRSACTVLGQVHYIGANSVDSRVDKIRADLMGAQRFVIVTPRCFVILQVNRCITSPTTVFLDEINTSYIMRRNQMGSTLCNSAIMPAHVRSTLEPALM